MRNRKRGFIINLQSEPYFTMFLSPKTKAFRNYVSGLLTVFYFIIVIIYAVVLELSFRFTDPSNKEGLKRIKKNTLSFWLYMYIVSFLFFGYWYILRLLKTRRFNVFGKLLQKLQRKTSDDVFDGNRDNVINEELIVSTALPNVGSLYLRFGAMGEFIFVRKISVK